MSSSMQCQTQVNDQITVYQTGVFASIALTVGVSVAAAHCLRNRLADSSYRARFYGTMGIIKLVLAASIVALVPACPKACVCNDDFGNFYFYPVVAAMIGGRWLSEAAAARRQGREPIQQAIAVPVQDPDEEEGAQMVSTMAGASSTAHTKEDYKDIPIVVAESSVV